MPPPPFAVIILSLVLALISACSPQPPRAKDALPPQPNITQAINTILEAPALSQTSVGISIVRLSDQRPLFSQNENKLFHPASTTKLFTSALALHYLGSQYTYSTNLAITGKETSTISTLYLIGSGDPSLSTEDIEELAEQLHRQGVSQIGTIVADATIFDTIPYGQGWMWDDQFYKDFAPISGLSVNRNCIEITVWPNKSIGHPLHINTTPETSFVTTQNRGKTVQEESELAVQRDENQANSLIISGTLGLNSPEQQLIRAIDTPPLYAATLLMEACRRRGIRVQNSPEVGTTPPEAQIIARHQSHPLVELLQTMNKNSINIYAEQLLKTVAQRETGETGSSAQGIVILSDLLESWQIPRRDFIFADGSGVSRYNLLTPQALTSLLVHIEQNPQLHIALRNSLAIGGYDGDLDWRMQSLKEKQNIQAKTGYLRGVSTLAGYIDTASGETLAFTIMMQHFKGSAQAVVEIQDRICERLSTF